MNALFEILSGNAPVLLAIVSLYLLIMWLIFFMRSEFKILHTEMTKGFSELRAADKAMEGTLTLQIQKVESGIRDLRKDMDYGLKDLRKDMDHGFSNLRKDMEQQGKDIRLEMAEMGKDIRTEMRQGFKDVRADMEQQGKDIRAEMAEMGKDIRTEMHQGFKDVRADMEQQGKDIRSEMKEGFTKRDHDFEKTLTTLKISGKEDLKPLPQQKQQ